MIKDQPFLGLNIIVGPDDKEVLDRCLKSCVGDLFDEMVVTLCMEKEDQDIRKVAESYGVKTYFFKWNDNFSDARNFSFSKNKSMYIMWVDSDDIIKPDQYKKLLEIKPSIDKWDIIVLNYVYSHDENDAPVLVLPRERIVKNCDHIKWHDPIHEYMNLDVPPGKLKRFDIHVDHYRTKLHNPSRNIEALKKVYESGNCSERIKFYYGKELADFGSWDKAVSVLEPYIKKGADFADNLTTACIRLARYYFERSDFSSAKNYALRGIRFNSIYAENYVILGNAFEHEDDMDTAASYYKEALNKKIEGGMSQIVDYYGFIPAAKLALLYYNKKEYEDTINYCKLALKHKPGNQQMEELLKMTSIEVDRLSKGKVLEEDEISTLKKFLEENNLNMSVIRNNIDFCDIRLKKIKTLSVVWLIPTMNINDPGVRIRRRNVCQELVNMGIDSRILTDYYGNNVYEIRNQVGDASVAIFTQFGKQDLEIMRHLRSAGIKCVFDHCEAMFNFPFENDFMSEVDLIACCSTKLSEMTREHGFMRTAVLRDAYEVTHLETPHKYKRDWE